MGRYRGREGERERLGEIEGGRKRDRGRMGERERKEEISNIYVM